MAPGSEQALVPAWAQVTAPGKEVAMVQGSEQAMAMVTELFGVFVFIWMVFTVSC
jgi:hypothetical protein